MPTGVYKRTEEHRKKISEANKGREFSEEHRKNISKVRTGKKLSEETKKKLIVISSERKRETSHNWKGGKIESGGYIFIKKSEHPYCNYGGYVREHRLVMEKELGRYLEPQEVVHHINGDKLDNRIENLKLCKNESEHQDLHKLLIFT